MFRLIPTMLLILISAPMLATPSGDRPPSKSGACAKTLATISDQSDQNMPAQLKTLEDLLEDLNDEAESQIAIASGTISGAVNENQTPLIKALRNRANEVLSAAGYSSNDPRRRGAHQSDEVPQIVLKAFQLARELESLQSQHSLQRLGSTWLQKIVPIDTPLSVLYEGNDVSETLTQTPPPVQRIEILAAKELLLYRGPKLVSTLYGAIYLVSYKEGDNGIPQTIRLLDSKRLEFNKVEIPPKPTSQRAKKMRITELSKALWKEIPEPNDGEVQLLLISDAFSTTIPLSAATAARNKAERNEKEAHDFPDFFWKFVTKPLTY